MGPCKNRSLDKKNLSQILATEREYSDSDVLADNEDDAQSTHADDNSAQGTTLSTASSQASQMSSSLDMRQAMAATRSDTFRQLPLQTQDSCRAGKPERKIHDESDIEEESTHDVARKEDTDDGSDEKELAKSAHTIESICLEEVPIDDSHSDEEYDQTVDIIEQDEDDKKEVNHPSQAIEKDSVLKSFSNKLKQLSFIKEEHEHEIVQTQENDPNRNRNKRSKISPVPVPPPTAFTHTGTDVNQSRHGRPLIEENYGMEGANDVAEKYFFSSTAPTTFESSLQKIQHQRLIEEIDPGDGSIITLSQEDKKHLIEQFSNEEQKNAVDTDYERSIKNKRKDKSGKVYHDIETGEKSRKPDSKFRSQYDRSCLDRILCTKLSRKRKRYILMAVVIVVLIIAPTIVLLNMKAPIGKEEDAQLTTIRSNEPVAAPTPQPISKKPPTEPQEIIEEPVTLDEIERKVFPILETITDRSILNDVKTSQNKAMRWIMSDSMSNLSTSTTTKNDAKKLAQRYILAIIYYTTSGPEGTARTGYKKWSNSEGWLTSKDECEWYGVKCTNGILTQLNLSNNDLDGLLPEEMSALNNLQELILENNKLSGEILNLIFQLRNLHTLNLNGNQVSGSIPSSINEMEEIKKIDLSNNSLEGEIPASIGSMTTLMDMRLSHNKLSGEIPSEIFRMENLGILALDNNSFEGSPSSDISSFQSIVKLRLNNNIFNGNLPKISGLKNLEELNLAGNAFTGQIPNEFASSSLRKLFLGNNYLTGIISEDIGSSTNLEVLHLEDNKFSMSIPESIGLLPNLKNLYLGFNSLTGDLPSSMENQITLQRLHLNNNNLSGIIPKWLGLLPNLDHLYLNNNGFKGPLPSGEDYFPLLSQLTIQDNDITGIISDTMCNPVIVLLTADCSGSNPKVECTCCTQCFP